MRRPAKKNGSDAREAHRAEDARPARAHRAQQRLGLGLAGREALGEGDRDREEGHERDQQHLGREAEAEPDHHQRRDRHDRQRLRRRRAPASARAAVSAEASTSTASAKPTASDEREAEQRRAQRRQRVVPEVAAVVPGHREHAGWARQHVVADPAEVRVELPGHEQQRRRSGAAAGSRARGVPCHQLWRGRYAFVKYDDVGGRAA